MTAGIAAVLTAGGDAVAELRPFARLAAVGGDDDEPDGAYGANGIGASPNGRDPAP